MVPLAIYIGKVAIKTAVDVGIDYASAKTGGMKFSLGKSLGRNLVSNTIPGLGEAKSGMKIVKGAKALKASRTSKGTGKGVVYERTDKNGGKYVGQAKSDDRYKARQKEHDRSNRDAEYKFKELGRATPGKKLNV